MRCAIDSDGKTKGVQEAIGGLRNGLRVKRYEPCFVEDRQLIVPEQRKNALRRNEGEIERIVREVYGEYASLFSLKSGRNIAVCATEYYTAALYRYGSAVSEPLAVYCRETGQTELFDKIRKIVSESEHFLLQGLREELKENAARYVLRPVSSYVRLAKLRLAHLSEERERGKTAQKESGRSTEFFLYEVCEALIGDCREKMNCFSKKAQHRYEAYVDVLCLWLGNRKIGLPEYADGEDWNVFCHALVRKRKTTVKNAEEGQIRAERKYCGLCALRLRGKSVQNLGKR